MEAYNDRFEAGIVLANHLIRYEGNPDVFVLALPRGGVPVGYEIARALKAPLDIFLVRKLGVPGNKELAMGAIGSGGSIFYNKELIRNLGLTTEAINKVIETEQAELSRRELLYRGENPYPVLTNKIVILVDDGMATGATMKVAINAVKHMHPSKIILAVPVAPQDLCEELEPLVDRIVCPLRPDYFNAVGYWYNDFTQTTDAEVFRLLSKIKQ